MKWLRRRPRVLRVVVCDRHAEHVDPKVPLCSHGEVALGRWDTLDISDSTADGPVIQMELRNDGLHITVNTNDYREARRAAQDLAAAVEAPVA